MKYVALTTMNAAILEATGRRMLTSLVARWPREVGIAVAFEGSARQFTDFESEFGEHVRCIDLLEEDAALVEWQAKNRHHPGQDSFRRCAWRFAYKSFAVTGVGMDLGSDVLIWLDADTFTHRDMPIEELSLWLPHGKLVAFLGRGRGGMTECGFVMYDMRSAKTRSMLHNWRSLYMSGALFHLEGWTDCHAFDWSRLKWLSSGEWEDLTPWGRGYQHVFINSPVGAYMDHMKGSRKGGKSRERDVVHQHVSPEFLAYLREE